MLFRSLDRMLIGVSASLNVESENESTNDFRAGAEFAWLKGRMYIGAELYYMRVGFTKRQKIHDSYSYTGGYIQGGYFITDRLHPALRYDLMDRNGLDRGGLAEHACGGDKLLFQGVQSEAAGHVSVHGSCGS